MHTDSLIARHNRIFNPYPKDQINSPFHVHFWTPLHSGDPDIITYEAKPGFELYYKGSLVTHITVKDIDKYELQIDYLEVIVGMIELEKHLSIRRSEVFTLADYR